MKRLMFAVCFTGSVLTGCSGGDGSTNATESPGVESPTPQPTANTMPVDEAISFLERKGELPILDRSRSLLGPDQDKNNVRDDIDSFISDLEFSAEEKAAARQLAQALQHTLTIDLSDEQVKRDIRTQIGRSVMCIGDSFTDPSVEDSLIGKLEAITFNTRERTERYIEFNNAMSGSVSTVPTGDTCNA